MTKSSPLLEIMPFYVRIVFCVYVFNLKTIKDRNVFSVASYQFACVSGDRGRPVVFPQLRPGLVRDITARGSQVQTEDCGARPGEIQVKLGHHFQLSSLGDIFYFIPFLQFNGLSKYKISLISREDLQHILVL